MHESIAPTVKQRRPLLVAISLAWLAACLAGLWLLWSYGSTPGRAEASPKQWPSESRIERSPQGETLLLFAHPRCPCTSATLSELERIVAESNGSVSPRIVFYKPRGAEPDWEKTDLWRRAAAVPGAVLTTDVDGVEARRFHASTSGHTLLYDAEGKLAFSGGITFARGHEGDNAGHSAIVNHLTAGAADCGKTPVFGCPIIAAPKSAGTAP